MKPKIIDNTFKELIINLNLPAGEYDNPKEQILVKLQKDNLSKLYSLVKCPGYHLLLKIYSKIEAVEIFRSNGSVSIIQQSRLALFAYQFLYIIIKSNRTASSTQAIDFDQVFELAFKSILISSIIDELTYSKNIEKVSINESRELVIKKSNDIDFQLWDNKMISDLKNKYKIDPILKYPIEVLEKVTKDFEYAFKEQFDLNFTDLINFLRFLIESPDVKQHPYFDNLRYIKESILVESLNVRGFNLNKIELNKVISFLSYENADKLLNPSELNLDRSRLNCSPILVQSRNNKFKLIFGISTVQKAYDFYSMSVTKSFPFKVENKNFNNIKERIHRKMSLEFEKICFNFLKVKFPDAIVEFGLDNFHKNYGDKFPNNEHQDYPGEIDFLLFDKQQKTVYLFDAKSIWQTSTISNIKKQESKIKRYNKKIKKKLQFVKNYLVYFLKHHSLNSDDIEWTVKCAFITENNLMIQYKSNLKYPIFKITQVVDYINSNAV